MPNYLTQLLTGYSDFDILLNYPLDIPRLSGLRSSDLGCKIDHRRIPGRTDRHTPDLLVCHHLDNLPSCQVGLSLTLLSGVG